MKQFKKVLAFVLALAMVVTAVPTADAKAAAKAPKLNNTKKILYVGQSYTLKIGNLPANWKKCTYAWSASNKNVTVKKGKYGQAAKVTAVKKGTATVTVKMTYPQTAAQKKAKKKTVKTFKCVVTVKNPSVKFTTTADRIEVGETAQFTAKATPSTAKVTYSSSDAAVATVDATGLVTAVADGTATIKASAKVGTKTVSASKTVEVYTAPTEAKQTKVKEITITSGKVVTKESKIAVKKGSVEVALAEKNGIAIDATGKTVVLTTASKLTKGEYTVTIDDATANFTAEDEKVTTIEFTSDKAVLDAATGDPKIYKTAKVAYKVYNQFKEDITDATPVTVSGNGAALEAGKKGSIVFTSSAQDGFRLNDIVAAVVIYNANGVAVTKSGTFTVSNESAISEITIKDGVYNKKGEAVTLTEDSDMKDAYVLVSAKDQYGRAVTKLTHNSEVVLQLAEGLTNLAFASGTSEEITVDGVKYAGFKLTKKEEKALGAGTATMLVISKGTGTTAQGTITVANGSKVDTISIQVPDLVVGNEDTKLGYTALDSYQKEVTSVDKLVAIDGIESDAVANSHTGVIYAKENPVTKKAELFYSAKTNTNENNVPNYDVKPLLTTTYKSSTVQFTIQPNAVPTAITGTKDLVTGSKTKGIYKIKAENIKVVDQYGRADKVSESVGYSLVATTGTNADDYKAFTAAVNVTVEDAEGNLATAAAKAGTSKVKFTLKKGTQELSTYEVEYNTVEKSEFKSYEVKDIDLAYFGANADSAYDKTFDVKGVTADGVKVTLTATTDYTVTTNNNEVKVATNSTLKSANLTGANGTAGSASTSAGTTLKDKETAEVKLTFTFTDGNTLEKTVTISKAAPVITTAKLKNDKETVEMSADGAIFDGIKAAIEAKDQYGVVDSSSAIEPNVTVTDLSDKDGDGSLAVTNNGLKGAAFVGLEKGDTATIKLTYPGGYVFTTKFVSTSVANLVCNKMEAAHTTITINSNNVQKDLDAIVSEAGITATNANGGASDSFTVDSVSAATGANVETTKQDSGNVIDVKSTATSSDNQNITVVIKNKDNDKTVTITVKVEIA